MRTPPLLVLLVACLSLSGCSNRSMIDGLQISKPSGEVTSSIIRPDAPVQGSAGASVGYPMDVESVIAALAEPDQADAQALQQVAMIVPRPPANGRIHRSRFRDAKPVNFGRITPQQHAVHGVDVSRWQGEIDWVKLKEQGANFAYIKATDGGDHLDPMFRRNWEATRRAGIPRGAYHFFYWCRPASEQADWFIRNVPKEPGALPPVLDVEWNHLSNCKRRPPREEVLKKMQIFMDRVERHYGQRPIIYTPPDFYRDNLKGAFPNHPFWLRSVAAHPSKVYPGRDWVFWQYSGSGLGHGVDGKIDLNVFHGNEAMWWQWLSQRAGRAAG
ncbi:GH25 family lysozyme [Chelativorans sp. Marseille-P2723]|uniref:glycoside hydrolase family 25 protein n=1 Tax=Chelativorans sp. Marseille-P2723 TaxID=2709133 RepID=UPI0015703FF7|nr:GH25 family lysozyme [Chelativorans sp. Marseille-P2723]